eukprot:g20394.t1
MFLRRALSGRFWRSLGNSWKACQKATQGLRHPAGCTRGSKAPSKVFEGGSLMAARTKPTSVTALSIANKPKSASTTNGVKQVPYRRKVTQDCESEGSGELELKDPDAPEGDLDRWVFGKKEKTGETGWFALGYTRDTEE